MASTSGQKPIGVALLGGGRIGSVHLKSLSSSRNYELLYTVDVDEARACEMASSVQGCKGIGSVDVALADDRVEAIVVCTPTATHKPIILKACEAKKHVFCEKPVSMQWQAIVECFDAAEKAGIKLYCGYQRRADNSFRKLKETVAAGSVGTVHVIKSTSRDHPTPSLHFLRISGGFYHDCASHDIDLCCWVAGEAPATVFALGSCFNPEIAELDDVDTALIALKFPSGVLATIDISRKAVYGYDQRLEVHGDAGMVQTENRPTTSCVISTAAGIAADNPYFSFPQRYEQAYATEIEHFYDYLRNDATPYCSRVDCIRVAQIADAAEHSARAGAPVDFAQFISQ
jgi:myo-inositol 2-dehydrogenase / D-chiro-inositol 1-dehydrogenase